MRLINIFVSLILFGVISLGFGSGLETCRKLDQRYFSLSKNKTSKEFVTKSFINTCKGKGFSDLNEWQLVCRELFNIEYIAWANANDFMDVSMANTNEDLFYGAWTLNGEINEVYCRKRRL